METLKLSKETAIKMYKETSDNNIKKILEESFGKNIFNMKITDRINSIEDVISILGENDDDVMEYRILMKYSRNKYNIANTLLTMITKVLNEGWVPNWADTNEKKWFSWWKQESPSSRFVFVGTDCVLWTTGTVGGSRLCFREKSLAAFAANRFPQIYNDFLVYNK